MRLGGWLGLSNPPEVKPIADLRQHEDGYGCWCSPTEDDGVIVHHALDQRELHETGKRRVQ